MSCFGVSALSIGYFYSDVKAQGGSGEKEPMNDGQEEEGGKRRGACCRGVRGGVLVGPQAA